MQSLSWLVFFKVLCILSFGCHSQRQATNAWKQPKRVVSKKKHLRQWRNLRRSGSSSATIHRHRHKDDLLAAVLRGGGGDEEDIDKTGTWSLTEVRLRDFVYGGLYGTFLVSVVVLCRSRNVRLARTGGEAPIWMTDYVSDYIGGGSGYLVTVFLHLAYVVVGLLLPLLLPPGLSKLVFSPPSVALLGTVLPAVESVRAAVTDSGSADRTWLMYWVIHGIFQYSTEFMDQLALKYDIVYKYWHRFEVLVVLWMVLPVTDGATLIYRNLAQPFLLPLVKQIKSLTDGWIAALALTTVNASYIWWSAFIFMSLPVTIKRYAVMGSGSIFPVISTIMALASTEDNTEIRWLTYWPCFSLLFLTMIGVEKFIGSFKGLYVACLAAIMYLMLPMFDGSVTVFRKVLVPLLNQRELLLLRDARTLAAELFKHVPVHRQEEARQTAANAFLDAF